MMRCLFMGSPAEVIPVAETLASLSDCELVGVVSQPARPVGRKQILTDPPVAQWAKEKGIKVFQPEKAGADDFLSELKRLEVDVAITAAYGQILTDNFLATPKRATINIHPSLLPAYRGATPVPQTILDGVKQTAVSILFTVKKLDAGNIVLQVPFTRTGDETAGDLTSKLFQVGAQHLGKALGLLRDVNFKGTPQDNTKATFCKKIAKQDGELNPRLPVSQVYNRFLAYQPWPGTFFNVSGKRVKVEALSISEQQVGSRKLGELFFDKSQGALLVKCADAAVQINKVVPAGGKSMDGAALWNGLKAQGDTLMLEPSANA